MKLSELKRKEIRKVIKVGNDEIKIFNPSKECRAQIAKTIFSNMDAETGKIEISPYDTLVTFMGLLTDIEIPTDEQEIQEVLNDESDELQEVEMEINSIINHITDTYVKTMINLRKTSEFTNIPIDTLIKMVEQKNELKELENQLKVEKEKEDKQEEIIVPAKKKRGRPKKQK